MGLCCLRLRLSHLHFRIGKGSSSSLIVKTRIQFGKLKLIFGIVTFPLSTFSAPTSLAASRTSKRSKFGSPASATRHGFQVSAFDGRPVGLKFTPLAPLAAFRCCRISRYAWRTAAKFDFCPRIIAEHIRRLRLCGASYK